MTIHPPDLSAWDYITYAIHTYGPALVLGAILGAALWAFERWRGNR